MVRVVLVVQGLRVSSEVCGLFLAALPNVTFFWKKGFYSGVGEGQDQDDESPEENEGYLYKRREEKKWRFGKKCR